jgi:hypothetical protein
MSPPITPAPTTCTRFAWNVPRLAEALQALLQEEHAHQIARRRRANDAVDQLRRRQRIALVARPDVDDRVRRRIMLARARAWPPAFSPYAPPGLERAVEQALQQRRTAARLIGEHQHGRRAVHHPRRHAVVGEAEAFGLPGIDRLAGQHHVQRRLRADPLGQAQHAAPAGNDAQHDLRQTHPRRRLVDRQQVTTGQRQFESAAEAVAAHQRQRRIRDGWPDG